MGLERVQSGDSAKGNLSARSWNAFCDTAEAFSRSRTSGGSSSFGDVADSRLQVQLPETVPTYEQFSVMILTEPRFTAAENLLAFKNKDSSAMKADIPAAGNQYGTACILQSGGQAGDIVEAMLVGVTPCQIAVTDELHTYARPATSYADRFDSDIIGPAKIIWKESGTGLKWAMVQMLGDWPRVSYLVKTTNDVTSGSATTDYAIYSGTAGSESAVSYVAVPSAFDHGSDIDSGDWAKIEWIDNDWEITGVESGGGGGGDPSPVLPAIMFDWQGAGGLGPFRRQDADATGESNRWTEQPAAPSFFAFRDADMRGSYSASKVSNPAASDFDTYTDPALVIDEDGLWRVQVYAEVWLDQYSTANETFRYDPATTTGTTSGHTHTYDKFIELWTLFSQVNYYVKLPGGSSHPGIRNPTFQWSIGSFGTAVPMTFERLIQLPEGAELRFSVGSVIIATGSSSGFHPRVLSARVILQKIGEYDSGQDQLT